MAAMVLSIAGLLYLRGQTGSLAYYQEQAAAFDGEHAMQYVQALSDPQLQGRGLGTPGINQAAQYIAEQFEDLGVQAAGDDFSYFQSRNRSYERLLNIPFFAIQGVDPGLKYHVDYAEQPSPYYNLGIAGGDVVFLTFGDLMLAGSYGRDFPALRGKDYSGKILMLLSPDDLPYLALIPRDGVLIVAENDADVSRHYTLSDAHPWYSYSSGGGRYEKDAPSIWITAGTANRLLEGSGYSVEDLRQLRDGLHQEEVFELPLQKKAAMAIDGELERTTSMHVIGHLPGSSAELDNKLIVVMAKYDGPAPSPDGNIYEGANDNASGLALILETIRNMQQTGYQPSKTFLFVAYSGEGMEGGQPVVPKVKKFLETKYGFDSAFETEAVIELQGLGTQDGDHLVLLTGGSKRLADLFESAAKRMNVPVRREGKRVDMSIVFDSGSVSDSGEEAPGIGLNWGDWTKTSHTPQDTFDSLSVDHLESAGKALNLALMILGREINY